VLHVRGRLQVVEPGPRLGGGLPAVPDHPGHHRAAAARRAQAGAGMSGVGHSRWRMLQVNGALMVLAVLSLAPLLWMLSVSFMPRGGASHFPPPLLPSEATLDRYRALFATTGIGRNFANSLLVSAVITALSLLVNTMAGYALDRKSVVYGRK